MNKIDRIGYNHDGTAAAALAAAYDTPPMAYVRSYGCQQNVNDGEKIKGVLMDVGYGTVSYTHLTLPTSITV